MKKILSASILIFVLLFCALTLVSCKEQLGTPSGFVLDSETLTLKWNPVKGAKYYTVSISGEEREITTKKTNVSLEKLEAGDYEIKVKANGDGEVINDSEWSVYTFKRDPETGLRYTLINNDTEYMLVGGGSAEGVVVMESYYRGKPVTAIDSKSLYGNTKITDLTVGANVKTIGSKAFSKCAKLESVTIPEGVTSIGEYAFQSCKALTKLSLPDSVTEIAPHIFSWCSALTDVKIGKNVTSIGQYAFANCEALVSVTYTDETDDGFKVSFPDSLKTIGTYAFTECVALPDVSIGKNVELIESYAFVYCNALSKIDLGEKIVEIEEYAFGNCEALASVSVPDSTTTLGNGVFFGCKALSDVSLGNGLKSLGYYIFNSTKLMETEEKLLIVDGWLIQILDTKMEKLTLRSNVYGIASYAAIGCSALGQVDAQGVKYIGDYAFPSCASLYLVSFDDALEEIGYGAFGGSKYLKDVTLGNNVKTIGDYAFYYCESLRTLKIPDSVTTVGTRAFRYTQAYKMINNSSMGTVYMDGWVVDYIPPSMNPSAVKIEDNTRGIAKYAYSGYELTSVIMPDSIKYICKGAFYKCTPRTLNLPKDLKYIGDYAFYNCMTTNFSGTAEFALVIPEGTEYIGRSAFYNCKYIISLTVPASVRSIGIYAFYGCTNIGAAVDVNVDTGKTDEDGNKIYEVVKVTGFVSLSEGLESIGDRAFQACDGIVEINVPDSVKYLGQKAFYKCPSLKKVTLGQGVTEINDYTFYKCEALESVTVSDNLEYIGNYAFRGCIALKEFDLKSVETIGRYSFYGCTALARLSFPATLDSIGDYAFRGCTGVTSIVLPENVETIGKHVFYGLKYTTIYSESAEKKEGWNYHYNSSFRPVFFGCTLSEDGKYVVSVDKDTLINANAPNGISAPSRDGYKFSGWATEAGSTTVAYTSENVADAPSGTVLYAIWTQQP